MSDKWARGREDAKGGHHHGGHHARHQNPQDQPQPMHNRRQQKRGGRQSVRKRVDISVLFNKHNHTFLSLPTAADLGIAPEALELLQTYGTVFWTKVVELFTSIVSKSIPCEQCVTILTGVLVI